MNQDLIRETTLSAFRGAIFSLILALVGRYTYNSYIELLWLSGIIGLLIGFATVSLKGIIISSSTFISLGLLFGYLGKTSRIPHAVLLGIFISVSFYLLSHYSDLRKAARYRRDNPDEYPTTKRSAAPSDDLPSPF
ncbi:MAG TPA: hypothetical protein VLL52_00360 [Anaerolineae bacterium]|nr:hypothetical protein [Anaerolineae bacterium]